MSEIAVEIAATDNAAALRRTKLGLGSMAAYGSGALVDSVTSTALGTFLLFYLTAVSGLSNSLAGLSLFVGLVVDALADPLVGSLSDNTVSKLGRRHPYLFVSPIPLAIMLGVLFSIPTGLSGWALFAFVTVVSIGLRICHSLFNLPYVALGAELSDDYHERTSVVASRFLFSVAGAVSCLMLTRVFMGGPGSLHRAAYAPFGWACAALIILGGLTASFGTLGTLKRLHLAARGAGTALARLIRDVVEIFRNPSFRALFASLLLVFTGAGVAGVLALHANRFFWKLPTDVIQMVLLAAPAGAFLGAMASLAFIHRFEKRLVVIVGLSVYGVQLAALPVLKIVGVLPAGGVGLYAILIVNAGVVAAFGTAMGIAFQSALADAADQHEFLFGSRREGLFFAGLNFSSKAAVGLGSLIAGVGLDLIRFPTNLAAHGGLGVHIGPATARNLGLLYGPGPALFIAAAIAVFLSYRLTRGAHAQILERLRQRREQPRPSTQAQS